MKKNSAFPLLLSLLVGGSFLGLTCHLSLAQQTPGIVENRRSSGNQNTFSYRIQSTYGTTTSAEVRGNMRAETEAVLRLKAGSKVTNKIGDDSGNASAVFVATPNGGNVDLQGITGENLFLIDDGTYFRSSLTSVDGPGQAATSSGTASATATHSTIVTVEKGSSTFQNTFEQAF
jgi:hypothetical protein